jgi:antitoxin component YwqK of YwqJK toxin-antitoxin module
LRSEEPFVDGALSGLNKSWFAGGERESEVTWDSGSVLIGKKWYESGGLREVGAQTDGNFECWYEDGQIMQKGELKAGLREGQWIFHKADGTPDVEMSGAYEAGIKTASL